MVYDLMVWDFAVRIPAYAGWHRELTARNARSCKMTWFELKQHFTRSLWQPPELSARKQICGHYQHSGLYPARYRNPTCCKTSINSDPRSSMRAQDLRLGPRHTRRTSCRDSLPCTALLKLQNRTQSCCLLNLSFLRRLAGTCSAAPRDSDKAKRQDSWFLYLLLKLAFPTSVLVQQTLQAA